MYVFSWNEMFTQPSHFRARNLHVITNVTLKLATSKCNCRYVIINIDIISNHYVKQWCQSRNRLRDARAIPIHTRGTKRFIPVMNKDERHTHEKYQRQIVPSWLDNMMMKPVRTDRRMTRCKLNIWIVYAEIYMTIFF